MVAVQGNRHDVWREVEMFGAVKSDPEVTDEELSRIIDANARMDWEGNAPDLYTAWGENTVYAVGDVVTSTDRHGDVLNPDDRDNGVYTVTVAGTSGTTEPTWPVTAGETVTDGTVTWERTAVALWYPTYDVDRAVYEVWRLKLGKAVERYDFAAGTIRDNESQIHKHCQEQVDYYASFLTGSGRMEGSTARDHRLRAERIRVIP